MRLAASTTKASFSGCTAGWSIRRRWRTKASRSSARRRVDDAVVPVRQFQLHRCQALVAIAAPQAVPVALDPRHQASHRSRRNQHIGQFGQARRARSRCPGLTLLALARDAWCGRLDLSRRRESYGRGTVDLTTGTQCRFVGSTNFRARFAASAEPVVFVVSENFAAIGRGSAADTRMVTDQHATITPDGSVAVSFNRFRLECK